MVRLILEQDGERRAFRVGRGVLTIGSDSAANLKLTGAGVAEQHAELEVVGDFARLRVLPGAAAPTLDGETVLGEVELHQGQALELPGAILWLEDEGSQPGSGRPTALGRSSAGPSASGGGSSGSGPGVSKDARQAARERAIKKASGHRDRSRVQRSRPRVQRGLPTGVTLGIVAAVLVVGGFALRKAFQVSAESSTNTAALLAGAEAAIDQALYSRAEGQLSIINQDRASPQELERMRALRAEIAAGYAKQNERDVYRVGNEYLETRLKKYERNHLQGNPAAHKIRLFLKRCQEFRSRWPEHEEMAWVKRQEKRFSGAVNLSLPPTYADIEWEVKFILKGTPRRYEVALDMIDEYLARTDTPALDREAMQVLRKTIEEERPGMFEDALQWARHEYEDGNDMKAVQWLVFSAAYMGDDALEDRAAEYLLEMPNLKGHLEAYQRDRPDVFEALMENDVARAKAEELGIL